MTAQQRTVGSGDDEVTFTADPSDVAADGAAVAFMRGRLKADGDTGIILDALRRGGVDDAFAESTD